MSSVSYELHRTQLTGLTDTIEPTTAPDAGPNIVLLDDLVSPDAVRTVMKLNGLQNQAWNRMHTMAHFDPSTYELTGDQEESVRVIQTNATDKIVEPLREDRILRAYCFTDGPALSQQLAIDALLSAHTNKRVVALELPTPAEEVSFDDYALTIGNLIPAVDLMEKRSRTGAERYGRAKNEQRRWHFVGASMGATVMLKLATVLADTNNAVDVASVTALAPVYKGLSDIDELPASLDAGAIRSGYSTTTTPYSPEQANIVYTGPHTNYKRLGYAIREQLMAQAKNPTLENANADTWNISETFFESVLEADGCLASDVASLSGNGTQVNLGAFRSDQVTPPYEIEEAMESVEVNLTRYIGRGTRHSTTNSPYVLMDAVAHLSAGTRK